MSFFVDGAPVSAAQTTSKQFRATDFLSPEISERMDGVVAEVFEVMLGLKIAGIDVCEPVEHSLSGTSERTAIVGLSGAMRGCCRIQTSSAAATSIASAMLGGIPIEEQDNSINDALGEICNMIAGGWKNSIAALSSECALSPPTVISGCDYEVHVSKPALKVVRHYKFDIHSLHLVLHFQTCDAFKI